eukprot:COSAG05_NODE_25521_length_196_cov_45.865979_1_plen_65_part_11
MASEGAFQGKMEVLCRELGDRAKLIPTDETCDEPVPPASVKHGYVTLCCAKEHNTVRGRIRVALE